MRFLSELPQTTSEVDCICLLVHSYLIVKLARYEDETVKAFRRIDEAKFLKENHSANSAIDTLENGIWPYFRGLDHKTRQQTKTLFKRYLKFIRKTRKNAWVFSADTSGEAFSAMRHLDRAVFIDAVQVVQNLIGSLTGQIPSEEDIVFNTEENAENASGSHLEQFRVRKAMLSSRPGSLKLIPKDQRASVFLLDDGVTVGVRPNSATGSTRCSWTPDGDMSPGC